jgi:hypothetical protein
MQLPGFITNGELVMAVATTFRTGQQITTFKIILLILVGMQFQTQQTLGEIGGLDVVNLRISED